MIEIKHRYTDAVIYRYDGDDKNLRQVVEDAVSKGVNLNSANLDGANLDGANLDGANLNGASLVGASLVGASLVGASLDDAILDRAILDRAILRGAILDYANLDRANLDRANLDRASLRGAILDGANLDRASLRGAILDGAILDGASLRGAILDGANLNGACLVGASLVGASLDGASLDDIKQDFYEVLSGAHAEVPGLLAALRGGKIDGSTYEGKCACLVGTIAKVRGCHFQSLDTVKPDSYRPAERWFLAIQPGHTPANHPVAKITEEWIEEWLLSNPL